MLHFQHRTAYNQQNHSKNPVILIKKNMCNVFLAGTFSVFRQQESVPTLWCPFDKYSLSLGTEADQRGR
jgi:hypothetical protein